MTRDIYNSYLFYFVINRCNNLANIMFLDAVNNNLNIKIKFLKMK